MDAIFGMCCVNLYKSDELSSQSMRSVQKPLHYIETRPGLVKVLRWFDQIEDEFRSKIDSLPDDLENLISEMNDQCDLEQIELSKGHEIEANIIAKSTVEDLLEFDDDEQNMMQYVLEEIEFFKVDS